MELREIGEFGLINRIRKWTSTSDPALLKGIGDDVAVIETGAKVWLVTTDLLIEDIHFELTWTDPFHLGRKALFVNLSDIAAMGGIPKYFLISRESFPFLPVFLLPGSEGWGKTVWSGLDRRRYFSLEKDHHQYLPFGRGQQRKPPLPKRGKSWRRPFCLRDFGRCSFGAENPPEKWASRKTQGPDQKTPLSFTKNPTWAGPCPESLGHSNDRCERWPLDRYQPSFRREWGRSSDLGGSNPSFKTLPKMDPLLFKIPLPIRPQRRGGLRTPFYRSS